MIFFKEFGEFGDLQSILTVDLAVDKIPQTSTEKWWSHSYDKNEDGPDLIKNYNGLSKISFVLQGFSALRRKQKVSRDKQADSRTNLKNKEHWHKFKCEGNKENETAMLSNSSWDSLESERSIIQKP